MFLSAKTPIVDDDIFVARKIEYFIPDSTLNVR